MMTTRPRQSGLTRRTFNRALAVLPWTLASCRNSSEADVNLSLELPYHHTGAGFRNPPGSPIRGGDFGDWMGFFYRGLVRDSDISLPPGHVLPKAQVKAEIGAVNGGDLVTWLGHACFLMRLNGKLVLTDPFLSDYASSLPVVRPRRFAPPALRAHELPPIDILLLSHNHYDHLDRPSLEALPRAPDMNVVVPLGVGRYLEDLAFPSLHEIDWFGQVTLGGLQITALPAIHFSQRGMFDRNETLWAGFALQSPRQRIYFAGDTAYGPVFKTIGRDLAPFDLGLVPIGAYAPRKMMIASHASPEEAAALATDLGLKKLAAMHWGSIRLTDEPPFEPPARFKAAATAAGYDADDVWIMAVGETRSLSS